MSEESLIAAMEANESGEVKKNRAKIWLIVAAKILIVLSIFALIYYKIDFHDLVNHLKSVKPLYAIIAFALLNFAQLLSSFRMQFYFSTAGYKLKNFFSVAIYYTGAFYNIILPGGISGDGYKAYFFKKYLKVPVRTSIRLMLSERASGLFFLCVLAIIFGFMASFEQHQRYADILLIIAAIILLPGYLISIRLILKETPKTAIKAGRYSLFSQASIALCAFYLLLGMGVTSHIPDYISVFMISCVVSILPISIGTAGIREFTFLMASEIMGLDKELGIALALAFFAIHISTSLMGLLFLGRLKKLASLQDVKA